MNKKLRKICTRRKKVILGLSFIIITVLFIIVEVCINRRNIMTEMNEPVILAFPLRGEWLSPNTLGTKIPSHGTNRFGTRYAYDFIQVDWDRGGYPAYRVSFIQYLLFGVKLENYYCWGRMYMCLAMGLLSWQRMAMKNGQRQIYFQICLMHIKMHIILILKKIIYNQLRVTTLL